MKVIGIDFTSQPSRRKPITGLICSFDGELLAAESALAWDDYAGFESMLAAPGPWIAGLDFPFGLPRRFIENIGWPRDWQAYVRHAADLGRDGFVAALEAYKRDRPAGDKEHKRRSDALAGSISPQKLYGVPVGKMFFEGAPRLLASTATIAGLRAGDPNRVVVESYPGVVARALLGKRSYKHDQKRKQTPALHRARRELFERLAGGAARERFGFDVDAPAELADDPTGDRLDSLLCALQAAWAWARRDAAFGMPADSDPLEGWIADPSL